MIMWNALLKTLEEPPPYVKFIFATTEGDKVLATIISRCQRFDLRRIQTNQIVDRLKYICGKESIHADEDALLAIARGAEGGMRDALSSLDQLIAFKGDTIAETDADGTKSIWYMANLDHSRLAPNTSGAATEYTAFTSRGYERLSYYWAYTGLAGTYYRGKDEKAQYAAFGLVATTPTEAGDIFNYNLNSSAYDAVYAPSSYPAQPSTGRALSYWMCSLSNDRYNAIGPWYVYSYYGPSRANGNNWGGRASPSLLEAEREARSE